MSSPEPLPLEVTCREADRLLRSASPPCLLDCREPEEHALVALTGARLIPMSELPVRVGELAPLREGPVLVLCHHGRRSLQVTAWLREQGFPLAQSIAGGIDRWAVDIDPSLRRY